MGSSYGSIRIETEREDYTGGETIIGRVIMDVNVPILCRGVRVAFTGLEITSWTTGSGKNQRTHSETITHVTYEKVLFGKEPMSTLQNMADAVMGIFSKDHYETVEPGNYEYDFSFILPEDCPGDYESGGSSRIRYEIVAYVDIPFALDFSEKKTISVYECFDLPEEKSVEAENSKTFLLDSANPLSVKLTVDSNLFYPGDIVTGSIEVENKSSKSITAITVGLNKKVDMRAHGSTTSYSSVTNLMTFENPSIPLCGPATFNFECKIPEDVYCTLVKSKILKVDYSIHVNVDVPWAVDLEVQVPIMILEEEGFPSGLKKASGSFS